MAGRSVFSGLVVATVSAVLASMCTAITPAVAAGEVSAAAPTTAAAAAASTPSPSRSALTSRGVEPVELPRERTASSRTFALPDGSRRTELFTAPVHYRTGAGRWAPIDNTLVDSSRPGYVAENAANAYRLQIPADAGADPVRFEAGGDWVTFTAESLDGAPRVNGSEASIGGLAPHTRVEYEALNRGVKETIVLTEPPAAEPSYAFTLRTSPGLEPRLSEAGAVDFVDNTGAVAFGMPAPFIVDSSDTDAGYSDAVSVDLQPAGSGWRLSLVPDAGWLADPARVYPVRVDPTVTLKPGSLDCWLAEGSLANTSQCDAAADYIRVGYNGVDRRRGLVKFDLSDIPSNATVSSANLELYLDESQTPNPGVAADYVVRRVFDKAWTNVATWNRYDGTTAWATPGGDFGTTDAGRIDAMKGTISGYKSFDPTWLVQDWVSGAYNNRGFLLKQQPETTDNTLYFYSADSGIANENRWPKLTVTYTEPTSTPFAKIGDRRFSTFDSHVLNDRMTAKVNVATGNLLLTGRDLRIAGTGLGASVERGYNSLDTGADPAGLTPGWVLGDAPTVRLEFPGTIGRVTFVGPGGYRVRFDQNADGGYSAADKSVDADLTLNQAANEYQLKWHDNAKWNFDGTTGRLKNRKDRQGNTVAYTYDANGRLSHTTDTQGRRINYTYNAGTGLLEAVTDVAGGRTYDYAYAQFPPVTGTTRLASVAVTSYGLGADTVNLNALTSFDYDATGRLTKITDPRNNETRIGYDGVTRRVATISRITANVAEPDSVSTYSYTGVLADCNDPDAVAITTVNGPRTDVSDLTKYCVDSQDRVVDAIDAQGKKRTTTYTAASYVNTFNESGVSGQDFNYSYNSEDNLTAVELPTGGAAAASYDDPDHPQLPTGVRDFATAETDSPTWAYTYDDNGYLIEAENSTENLTFRYCYDGKGQLQRIDPPDAAGANSTTLDNNLTAGCGTANQGNDTLLTYNAAGQLTQVDPPDPHGTRTFTYDAASRVKTSTDGRGVVSTYTYDALDRVTRIAYNDPTGGITAGAPSIDYGYDPNGNLTSRQQVSDNTNFTYDDLNRMIKESPDAPAAQTDYLYDPAGNLTSIDVSDQIAPVSYTYDNLNRVNKLTDQRGLDTTFGYNNRDQRTTTAYPNGVTQKQVYDNSRRTTCIYAYTGSPPATGGNGCPSPSTNLVTFRSYDYTSPSGFDTTTRYEETNRNGFVTSYTYDDAGRLTRAREMSGATERSDFEYIVDRRGNITRETVTGSTVPDATTSYGYNDAGEMCYSAAGAVNNTCTSPPAGATTYNYDNAGNLASSSAGLSATYNLQNQNTQLTPPGGQPFDMEYADATSDRRTKAEDMRMSYDVTGLSSQGTSSGTPHSEWFVRDPHGTLAARRDSNSNNSNARDLFYLYDAQGSVIATTGYQGGVVEYYSYEPYGQEDNATAGDDNPWRYLSGYHDTTTGMIKFGARYYQPDLMRWTQTDPVAGTPANPMTLNPYAYAGSNPISFTDASGTSFFDEWIWSTIGGVLGGAFGTGLGLAFPAIVGWSAWLGAAVGGCIGGAMASGGGDLGGMAWGCLQGAVIGLSGQAGTWVGNYAMAQLPRMYALLQRTLQSVINRFL